MSHATLADRVSPRVALLLIVLSAAIPSVAQGQASWFAVLRAGPADFGGTSIDLEDGSASRPDSHLRWEVGVSRSFGTVSTGLLLTTSGSAVAVEGGGAQVGFSGVLRSYGAKIEVQATLLKLSGGGLLVAGLAPFVEYWDTSPEGKVSPGIELGTGFDFPLAGELNLTLGAHYALGFSSAFRLEDLPDGKELRNTTRRSLMVGLRQGL